MLLKDKIALITGGNRGIGLAISNKFIENGAKIIIMSTSDISDDLKSSFGDGLLGHIKGNLMNESESMFKKALDYTDKLDILVNNAGITRDNLSMRIKDTDWDDVININLKAAFKLSVLALKKMSRAKAGKIINLSSVVGQTGNIGQANYSASKGGLIALTKTLAQEYAKRNIQINAVAPGMIKSDMTDKLSDSIKNEINNKIPMGYMGDPIDVANSVVFLSSNNSDYITGQVINVNGGMYM